MNEQRQQAPALDPDIERFAAEMQASYAAHGMNGDTPVQQAREIAEQVRAPWVRGGPQMALTEELQVPAGLGAVRIRIHTPAGKEEGPALVYLHGGGWAMFSLDTHDRLMREYAARAGIRVIGVDYSLSPEAKFPQAIEECLAVMEWLQAHGGRLGVDAGRLAIGGDSAGANLAVATCIRLRDEKRAATARGLLLNYGAFDAGVARLPDGVISPQGFTLTYEEMKFFWWNYLRGPKDLENPLANLLLADLHGLPPALLVIAECDTLQPENLAMAERFRRAGVAVRAEVYPGTTHSFLEAVSIAPVAARALDDSAAWLRSELG